MSDYTFDHPKRVPPSTTGRFREDRDGTRHPVIVSIAMPECGQRANLRGIGWVECVRVKGHPMSLVFAHSNGLGDEWCFDEEAHDV